MMQYLAKATLSSTAYNLRHSVSRRRLRYNKQIQGIYSVRKEYRDVDKLLIMFEISPSIPLKA